MRSHIRRAICSPSARAAAALVVPLPSYTNPLTVVSIICVRKNSSLTVWSSWSSPAAPVAPASSQHATVTPSSAPRSVARRSGVPGQHSAPTLSISSRACGERLVIRTA